MIQLYYRAAKQATAVSFEISDGSRGSVSRSGESLEGFKYDHKGGGAAPQTEKNLRILAAWLLKAADNCSNHTTGGQNDGDR